jgi:hypothetical protein
VSTSTAVRADQAEDDRARKLTVPTRPLRAVAGMLTVRELRTVHTVMLRTVPEVLTVINKLRDQPTETAALAVPSVIGLNVNLYGSSPG